MRVSKWKSNIKNFLWTPDFRFFVPADFQKLNFFLKKSRFFRKNSIFQKNNERHNHHVFENYVLFFEKYCFWKRFVHIYCVIFHSFEFFMNRTILHRQFSTYFRYFLFIFWILNFFKKKISKTPHIEKVDATLFDMFI